MTKEMVEQIKNNPKYQELVTKRSKFAWTLSIIILVVYYAFILFIAFSPETLGTKISPEGMMTWGIPVGIAIIVFAFALTGIYVKRANSEFDGLLNDVKSEVKEMK
ncbi:MAG: DUF485 domain-containing protein [Epsilonproteobacteria bacterium]|nr:DUF485 domain-containing protein [Campylobacterota bacterium]